MYVDEVELASFTKGNKGFQIVQPSGPGPVCDSRGAKSGAEAFERHHELLVHIGGILGTQIGLAGIIWLIGSVRGWLGVSIDCIPYFEEED